MTMTNAAKCEVSVISCRNAAIVIMVLVALLVETTEAQENKKQVIPDIQETGMHGELLTCSVEIPMDDIKSNLTDVESISLVFDIPKGIEYDDKSVNKNSSELFFQDTGDQKTMIALRNVKLSRPYQANGQRITCHFRTNGRTQSTAVKTFYYQDLNPRLMKLPETSCSLYAKLYSNSTKFLDRRTLSKSDPYTTIFGTNDITFTFDDTHKQYIATDIDNTRYPWNASQCENKLHKAIIELPPKGLCEDKILAFVGPLMPVIPGMHQFWCIEFFCNTSRESTAAITFSEAQEAMNVIRFKGQQTTYEKPVNNSGSTKTSTLPIHAFGAVSKKHLHNVSCGGRKMTTIEIVKNPRPPTILGPSEVKVGEQHTWVCLSKTEGTTPEKMTMYFSGENIYTRRHSYTYKYQDNLHMMFMNLTTSLDSDGQKILTCAVEVKVGRHQATRVQTKTIDISEYPKAIIQRNTWFMNEPVQYKCDSSWFHVPSSAEMKKVVFGKYDFEKGLINPLHTSKKPDIFEDVVLLESCEHKGIYACQIEYIPEGQDNVITKNTAEYIEVNRDDIRHLSLKQEQYDPQEFYNYDMIFTCHSVAPTDMDTVFYVQQCGQTEFRRWEGHVYEMKIENGANMFEHLCSNEVDRKVQMRGRYTETIDPCGIKCSVEKNSIEILSRILEAELVNKKTEKGLDVGEISEGKNKKVTKLTVFYLGLAVVVALSIIFIVYGAMVKLIKIRHVLETTQAPPEVARTNDQDTIQMESVEEKKPESGGADYQTSQID